MAETFAKAKSDQRDKCKGRLIRSVDGDDYDCEYPEAGGFGCEDCIFGACGGSMDPRTGKKVKPTKVDKYGIPLTSQNGEPVQCERCGHRWRTKSARHRCSVCGGTQTKFLAG